MAIQEDYPAWAKVGCTSKCGKLLLVDQADYNTHHIFFDDNADEYDDCILDVRDVITGEKIPYKKFINMYLGRMLFQQLKTWPTFSIVQRLYLKMSGRPGHVVTDEGSCARDCGFEFQ